MTACTFWFVQLEKERKKKKKQEQSFIPTLSISSCSRPTCVPPPLQIRLLNCGPWSHRRHVQSHCFPSTTCTIAHHCNELKISLAPDCGLRIFSWDLIKPSQHDTWEKASSTWVPKLPARKWFIWTLICVTLRLLSFDWIIKTMLRRLGGLHTQIQRIQAQARFHISL